MMGEQSVELDTIHWGHVDARPTSLHGNGAASFERTTLDPYEVTCRLCVTLLVKAESLSWIDRQGDVWRVGDGGLMYTPETAPFSREYVERKWGPLRLVDPRTSPAAPTTCDHCPNPTPANDALCEPCKWAHYYDVDRARHDEWWGEVPA